MGCWELCGGVTALSQRPVVCRRELCRPQGSWGGTQTRAPWSCGCWSRTWGELGPMQSPPSPLWGSQTTPSLRAFVHQLVLEEEHRAW